MARGLHPIALVLVASALLGCAGDEGRRRSRTGGERAAWTSPAIELEGEAPHEDDAASARDGVAQLGSQTVFVERFADPAGRGARSMQTVALTDSTPAAEPRPRRRRNVDVDLQAAAFDDVARMLGEVGGFAIVVEAPGAGTVHATLRGVDAWDALVAITHAKKLEVTWNGSIAIVRAP